MVKSNIKRIVGLYGRGAIAKFLGVSEQTITNYCARGFVNNLRIEKLAELDKQFNREHFINDIRKNGGG